MFHTNGYVVEQNIVKRLDNQKFKNISNNLRHMLKHIFGFIEDEDVVYAEHCDPRGKPDIKITINDEVRYLSVKSGQSRSIHAETLVKFTNFLAENNISKETIETICLYQYGDGTIDGTGTKRLDYDQLLPLLSKKIKKANEELNESSDLLMNLIEKTLFKGNFEDLPPADCVYHGNDEYGVVCTKRQIVKHLRRKNYDFMHNLHIGPIQFRPYARYTDFNEKNPEKRGIVQFSWINFINDLSYITERYDD